MLNIFTAAKKIFAGTTQKNSYMVHGPHRSAPLVHKEYSDYPFFRDQLVYKLEDYFKSERPYLNPNLHLNDVTRELGTNRNYLSKAINTYYERNFSQFCSYFRLAYACDLFINDPKLDINDMYIKSGFRSVSSFRAAFNYYIGVSPAKWCKNVERRISRKEDVKISDYLISIEELKQHNYERTDGKSVWSA